MKQNNGLDMALNNSVVIENPLHIPAVIYTIEQNSDNSSVPSYTLLLHKEEPCIIRGRNQQFSGQFNGRAQMNYHNGIPEIKRQDGGNSWYHGRTTCLIKNPNDLVPQKSKKFEDLIYDWHELLINLYSKYSDEELVHMKGNADIYSANNLQEQLFGTSAYNSITRACWYENPNYIGEIIDLAQQDEQVEDIDKFKSSLGVVKEGFSNYLEDILGIGSRINSGEFITSNSLERAIELQKKQGRLKGPCIGGNYPYFG